MHEGGRRRLFGRFKRIALGLAEKGGGPLARSPEGIHQSLADCIEMVRLAHAGGELGSVLPAVGEHDELADMLGALRRDVAEERIREHLRDFLETGPLAADRGSNVSAAPVGIAPGAS